jgi:asparagine synthase (glutamine-hydrolysing)
MCGIAGFVGQGDISDLRAMMKAMAHRGPDGEGEYLEKSLALFLGHLRLAIRDIEGGAQPMWDRAKTTCVIYNGEIYNHESLRAELIAAGHQFESSHSDTEVLVHGYKEWGNGLAERLNGMFAFAIYDARKRLLYLARDRFGEKPLYYTHRRGLFAFASELSALVAHRAIEARPSATALRKLFAYGYLPAPHALHEGTAKLPGGHYMVVDLETLSAKVEAYWRFTLEPDDELGARGEDALAEELRHLLVEATARRLVSDVPIGLFLSGGLDSSAILAAAAKRLPAEKISTYTIGFREPSYDESPFARTVASHIGSRHHERILGIEQARDLIPDVLHRLDEPTADPSIVPTYLLSAFARESVTVALSGDGGDELLAGYDPFKALNLAALYSKTVPRPVHNLLRWCVEYMPRSTRNMSMDFKLRRTLMGAVATGVRMGPDLDGARRPDGAERTARRARYDRGPLQRGDGTVGVRPGQESDRPAAAILHLFLSSGRHPREGRQGRDDVLAGDARGVPRQRSGRFLPTAAQPLQVSKRRAQVPAEEGARAAAAEVDPQSAQEGFRHPGDGVDAGSAADPPNESGSRRQYRLGRTRLGGASRRPRRQPTVSVDLA